MFRIFGILLILTACSIDRPDYGSTLQPWLGQQQERLEQSWGQPYNVEQITPNTKLWTYMEFSSKPIDGDNPYPNQVYYPAIAMPDFDFPSTPQYSVNYCKTLFTITDDVVVNYSFNGDDCVVNDNW